MSRPSISLMRAAVRRGSLARSAAQRPLVHPAVVPRALSAAQIMGPAAPISALSQQQQQQRSVATSSNRNKGLSPDSEDPHPKAPEPVAIPKTAAPLEDAEYHELADEYLETMLSKLEEVAEQRSDVDVEFSAGVLTLTFPPLGTYVINKQPPNKQIWLSSPTSGPKRYDWVIIGDGQNQKEGTASGDWIYLRDGSSLGDLFLAELDIDLNATV